MVSVFERAKAIPASSIAERYGIALKRKGQRHWANCPFHSDRHASMCFYPDGSWYCFSCHAGGDSVNLLAKLKDLPMMDAARVICGEYQITGSDRVICNVYTWKSRRVKALKKIIGQAVEYTGRYTVETADQAWNDPVFIAAIQARSQADCEIDELYAADREELEQLMAKGCDSGQYSAI